MDSLSLTSAVVRAGTLTEAEQQGGPQKDEDRKEEMCHSSITQQRTCKTASNGETQKGNINFNDIILAISYSTKQMQANYD